MADAVERRERQLTNEERAHLHARLTNARHESRVALVKTGGASAGVCGALAIATLFASDAPPLVVVGFWALLAAGFTGWIGLPWRRLMRGQVTTLSVLLRANRAREARVQSSRVVEFEEVEDEGACYAFEYGPGTSLIVTGQEFYEDEDFPNTDFSIVEILNDRGDAGDVLIRKHGKKLKPERVVPAAIKKDLHLPEDLSVIPARLDEIETALRDGWEPDSPRAVGLR